MRKMSPRKHPSKYCDKKRSDSDKKCITKNTFLGGNDGK
jgi:hypothetical protein